ncbi:MAG: ferrochelatase [bacterium]|nr:ferrochelatase [bacterium]
MRVTDLGRFFVHNLCMELDAPTWTARAGPLFSRPSGARMTAPATLSARTTSVGRTTGLILCGMGRPGGPDAVEPFLRNLFRDPEIIPIPRLLSPVLGRLIARRRAPAVRRRYLEMGQGGGSPQVPTTRAQGERLAALMGGAGRPTVAAPAMRYWRPYPDGAVSDLRARGAEQFLVLPMYPQYSDATNGSTLAFVQAALDRHAPGAAVHVVEAWHLLDGFVATLAANAGRGLRRWAEAGADPQSCALIYVAHSLPESFVKRGDPYLSQTRATVSAVHERVRAALAAGGHAAWLARLCRAAPPAGLPEQGRPHQVARSRDHGRDAPPGRRRLPPPAGAARELHLRAHRDAARARPRAAPRGREPGRAGLRPRRRAQPRRDLARLAGVTTGRRTLPRGGGACLNEPGTCGAWS